MKKIIKSTWTLFLLPILVTIIGGLVEAKIESVNILEGMLNFLKWIFNGIIFILNINIPLWILLMIGIILLALLFIIAKITSNNVSAKKWYEDYTDDFFNGIRYAWEYSESYNKFKIENFRPVCNKCKGELIPRKSIGNHYYAMEKNYCPNCDKILEKPSFEEIETAHVYAINKLKKECEKIKENN